MQENKVVSVITITRNREYELIRCIESVKDQDYDGRIEHIIIGDSSGPLKRRGEEIRKIGSNVVIHHLNLERYESEFIQCYAPSRTGFMRNVGIKLAKGEYICQLDDDNTYDRDHISSLAETIESEPDIDVAYSWRRLVYKDRTPYIEEEYPWMPDARLAFDNGRLSRYIYDELVKANIRVPGTNIVRDSVLTPDGKPVYTVDTSELMVKRHVHERFLFTVKFPWRQMVGDYSDDYAFVKKCHDAGHKFKCSEKATLTYTIGGVSNK